MIYSNKRVKLLTILFFSIFQSTFSQYDKEKINSPFELFLHKGFKYHDNRKLDSCQYYLKKLDSLVQLFPNDSSKFHRKELLKATYFIRKSKNDEASEKILKALYFFKQKKDSANIGFATLKLAIANYYLNRRLIARKKLNEALQYKNHLPKRLLTRIHQNLGSINLEEGLQMGKSKKGDSLKYEAIKNYKEAIVVYKHENWLLENSLATSLLAECYHGLEQYDKALIVIEDAISSAKKGNFKSQLGFALIKKADFLENKRRYDEALQTIKIAGAIFKDLEDLPTLLYALIIEKKILTGAKKYKEATIVGDSILNVSVKNYDMRFTDKVSEMEAKYKTAEKEREIAKQKEKLLTQEITIKTRNLYALILGGALVILGILSFGFYRRNKLKQEQLQKEIELKEALAAIKTQNKLQEQRLRISRDLHDNIGAQLTFIVSSLDNLHFFSNELSEKIKAKISNISAFTVDTIYQLRDTIWAMKKSEINLEELTLRSLSFIEKAKVATNNSIGFTINSRVEKPILLTSLQGINLFRCLQESVNNAIKYADASEIIITSKMNNNRLLICIEDNGKGFNINEATLGSGLSNIEHRMGEISGKANIQSVKSEGTTIQLMLPL